MSISSTLDQFHFRVKQKKWLRYFTVFNRISLAAGGQQKIKSLPEFCNCIHEEGKPLDSCVDEYNKDPEDSLLTPK